MQVTGSSGERTLSLVAEQPRTISVRGETTLALTEPVGITEIDAGIHRIVDVPGTADTYFFQRLMPETTTLQRVFTTAEAAEWELSSPALIDGSSATNTVFLPAGRHELVTDAETITLRRGPKPAASLSAWEPVTGDAIAPADQDRLLITTHAFNPGLQASLDNEPLTPQLGISSPRPTARVNKSPTLPRHFEAESGGTPSPPTAKPPPWTGMSGAGVRRKAKCS